MSRKSNVEKFVEAVADGDNKKALANLEMALRKKARARIRKVLEDESRK